MSTDRPQLYYFPVSANAYRAKLVLSWLKIDFDEVLISMADGSQKTARYLRVNPLGQLPALTHGEFTVWDSHAIALYACEQLGGAAGREIWPTDPAARAAIAKWTYFDANELHNGIGMARNNFTFGYPCDGDAARQRGEAALRVMDDVLGRQPWLEPGAHDFSGFDLLSSGVGRRRGQDRLGVISECRSLGGSAGGF